MGQLANTSRTMCTHALLLAVATILTGFSAFNVRGGLPETPHLALGEREPTEQAPSVHPGGGEVSLASVEEAAVASGWSLLSPPPNADPQPERFIADAGVQADVEMLIPARGNGEMDARVLLLEATTQRWVREGHPYEQSRSMCEVFSDRGDWRFVPPRCSRKEH